MIDITSLWSFVQDWWFPILGYGLMGVVVIEAAAEVRYTQQVRRKLKWFCQQVVRMAATIPHPLTDDQPMPNPRMNDLRDDTARFNADYVVDAGERMQLWYATAPLMGLTFTTLQLAVALPTAFEVIQTEPEAFFRSVGVAVGTTAMGAIVTIAALIAALRLDSAKLELLRAFENQRTT